jgi:hypothetical protein
MNKEMFFRKETGLYIFCAESERLSDGSVVVWVNFYYKTRTNLEHYQASVSGKANAHKLAVKAFGFIELSKHQRVGKLKDLRVGILKELRDTLKKQGNE